MNANTHVLPDSRLRHNPTLGSVVVDWELPSGTVRCEAVPIYCANCGKLYGHVPKDNTTFAFYLCNRCYEDFGVLPGSYAQPDDAFCRAVSAEMVARFGRDLTAVEIAAAKATGELGRPLELLERDSPYPVPTPR